MKVENGDSMVATVDPAHSFRPGVRKGIEVDFQLNIISLPDGFAGRAFSWRWRSLLSVRCYQNDQCPRHQQQGNRSGWSIKSPKESFVHGFSWQMLSGAVSRREERIQL